MKTKKIIVLAVTISFPVILYLFLRSFGQNQYDLPYFFEEESINCVADQGLDKSSSFYSLESDTVSFSHVFDSSHEKLTIVMFPSLSVDNQSLKNELNRAIQELEHLVEARLIAFYPYSSASSDFVTLNKVMVENYFTNKVNFDQLVNCNFKLPTTTFNGSHPTEEAWPINEIVMLIDEKNNIRGYYNGFETKEIDRLILEVNVLLSKK